MKAIRELIWLVTCHSNVLCTSTFCAKATTDVDARESKFRRQRHDDVVFPQRVLCQGSCSTYVIWTESQVSNILLFPCWDAAERWACSNNNRKLLQLAEGRSAPEWNDLCQKLRKVLLTDIICKSTSGRRIIMIFVFIIIKSSLQTGTS